METRRRGHPWWHDLSKVIPMIGALIGIATWITTTVMADAKRRVEEDQLHEKVEQLDKTVQSQGSKLEESEVRQQLIQQDLSYLKESQREILDALKRRR